MLRSLAALLCVTVAVPAVAHPWHDPSPPRGLSQDPPGPGTAIVPKEQLLVPPAGARHYVIVSDAAKHGDIWQWTQADGSIASRMSMSLRGWITETDGVLRKGADGFPEAITIRGVSPNGNAAESFTMTDGVARWAAAADRGESRERGFYQSVGGPSLLDDHFFEMLAKAGDKGVPLLPSGRAVLTPSDTVATVSGPGGEQQVRLAWVRGTGMAPSPVWLDAAGRFWAQIGWISGLPAGYEANAKPLRELQQAAETALSRETARRFLAPENSRPVLFDNVLLFDSLRGRFVPRRAVLVENGRIAAVGAAGSLRAPANGRTIDGRGKSLVPGLWDAHKHAGSDNGLVDNLAMGMTSFRSPGTMIERAHQITRGRAAGEVLVGEGWHQAIIDRKDPLAAQGAMTVSSAAETVEAVRKIKAAGMWGVKFYTSMDPSWIAPGAAEAKRLGLWVNGHVPARMRPLEAVRAGYQELTHLNFVVMQLMPQHVVDRANTAARLEGPAKYAKDLNLGGAEAQAMFAELKRSGTWVDPTLVIFESLLTSDGGTPSPAVASFADVVPPLVARGFRAGGHPLVEGLTRDDYRQSFAKMVELVGALHKAGVPIVAGTDGNGRELVREIELYHKAGMTPAQALQTATINVARLVGADKRTGSITVGKEADLVLVDGDVSRDLGALRRTSTVVSDGVVMDADALRAAAGYTGRPK
jgi:imidazolonepropionase-like amidohydrolase